MRLFIKLNHFYESRITQTIVAELIATAIMTVVGPMAPYMGLPKMNPAALLSRMMGFPIMEGYIMHCMIRIIFAAA